MIIEQELATIKKRLDTIKTQRIESATRLKGLEEDKVKLLAECTALGVDPKEINKAIEVKESEIKTMVDTIKGSLEQFNVISA